MPKNYLNSLCHDKINFDLSVHSALKLTVVTVVILTVEIVTVIIGTVIIVTAVIVTVVIAREKKLQ